MKRQPPKSRKEDDTDHEEVKGLTAITVRGFKSIRNPCHTSLRRLTIFAGDNNSGKSSLVQPLLLLKQTLDAPYDPGPLEISGPNVKFTDVDQFLSKYPGGRRSRFISIKLEINRSRNVSFRFERDSSGSIDIQEVSYEFPGAAGSLSKKLQKSEIRKILPKGYESLEKAVGKGKKRDYEWRITTNRFFISAELRKTTPEEEGVILVPSFNPGKSVEEIINGMIHVPGLRGNPARFYRTTAIGPRFPGIFNEYIASIIRNWKNSGDDRLNKLDIALRNLGLTWKVDVMPLDATRVEIHVGRVPKMPSKGERDLVNIADVGFGVSQVLPVVVALLAARPNQLVYIEQPEIHLHPQAEIGLAQIIADAANRKVRVLIETHSALLLRAIQSLVAEEMLSQDRVILHWFSRRPKDGVTTVTSGTLDKAGAFGNWPMDLVETQLKAEDRYIDLAERQLMKRGNDA